VVRPTSETIIGHMMAQWIHSWRDLPLLLNQWCDVVRWEMRTKLFIPHAQLLLAGGPHGSRHFRRCDGKTQRMLDVYYDFAVDDAAVAVMPGRKSESEKFAGAEASFSLEAMMGDKKALQAPPRTFSARTLPGL